MSVNKNNKDCRELRLTHEQIELIVQALGIAETKFTQIHKDVIDTVLVRGVDSPTKKAKENSMYHEKACQFADINNMITNSSFDV